MQHKHNKTQSEKASLRAHERAGAAFIVLGMLAGSLAVSQELRRTASELVMHPVLAVIEHSNRESEVAHRSMRFESVMPVDPVGGE